MTNNEREAWELIDAIRWDLEHDNYNMMMEVEADAMTRKRLRKPVREELRKWVTKYQKANWGKR